MVGAVELEVWQEGFRRLLLTILTLEMPTMMRLFRKELFGNALTVLCLEDLQGVQDS